MTVLVVDNLSPFTPMILASLKQIDPAGTLTCKKFDEINDRDIQDSDRIILSGRRSNSAQSNKANSRIVKTCYAAHKPLLGICYGAEIISLTLGGSISKMTKPSIGHTQIEVIKPSAITGWATRSLNVYESHGYCIAHLPTGFSSVASSTQCRIEIFHDSSGAIWGTQFHPEKSGEDGLKIFENFLRIVP